MRVIIAGGRDVPSEWAYQMVREAIAAFTAGGQRRVAMIINGGAGGIDAAARRLWREVFKGREDNCGLVTVTAAWKTHGRAAGPIRNRLMAQGADALIAIWDGKSPGTKNMIETAKAAGLEVFVHRYNSSK